MENIENNIGKIKQIIKLTKIEIQGRMRFYL